MLMGYTMHAHGVNHVDEVNHFDGENHADGVRSSCLLELQKVISDKSLH